MVARRSPRSNRARWHRLVERYTPDGALGRLLFALGAGTAGALSLSLAVYSFVSVGLGWLLAGLALAGAGVAASLLAIVVLWPVYLSLIGTVESPAAYAAETGSSALADEPVEVLKRQYAAGAVSDEEFERRLDALLEADERSGSTPTSGDDRREPLDPVREAE